MPWKIVESVDGSWVVEPESNARRMDHRLERSAVRIEAGYYTRQFSPWDQGNVIAYPVAALSSKEVEDLSTENGIRCEPLIIREEVQGLGSI